MKYAILLFLNLSLITMYGQTDGYKTYSDKTVGVSIKYPSTWEYQQNPRTVFILMRPVEESGQLFKENINLIITPSQNRSLKEYILASKPKMQSQLTEYREISTEYLEIKGKKFARIIYEHTASNIPLKVAYYVVLNKDKIYNLTCSATDNTFIKFFPIFEIMIQSFTF